MSVKKVDKRNDFANYKDEGKHQKFVSNKHFVHEIDKINPLKIQYKKYWKEIKRRCIEGYWHDGKWMPGNLYFYINLCKIKLNKDKYSTTKVEARPFLRDLEWEKAYVYAESRGFSGFMNDEYYTCYNPVREIENLKGEDAKNWRQLYDLPETVFKSSGALKKHIPAREYLRKVHTKNLGKPLYQNEASNVIDIECRGGGKDLIHNTLLHYVDGSKRPISNVKVGDSIIGGDGKPTTVIERKDFNDQMQYQVTLATGRTVTCGGGHLWTVYFRGRKKTFSLDEIKESYFWVRSDGTKDYKYAIPSQGTSEFKGSDPNIDPYFLGLWLGDGNSHNCGITTIDDEIIEFLHTLKKKEKFQNLSVHIKKDSKASTYVLSNGRGKVIVNPLKDKLKELNLIKNKHIPIQVMSASIEYRMSVLQGLMDSDGYCDKSHIELTTSYTGLKKTLPEFIRGLGIKCKVSVRHTIGKDSMRISLFTSKPVFKLSRKLSKMNIPSSSTLARQEKDKIVDIQPIGVYPSVCIGVDNKDHLFIVDDHIVTHNSYWAANGMILHNFLMDGATDYDVYLSCLISGNRMTSETLVGAIDGKYTKDLLDKVQLGMDSLIGEQIFQNNTFPSPLAKEHSGSWYSGKQFVKAKVDKMVGGKWRSIGSGATIHHRTFKDDEHAGNGTRPSLSCLEEVGFFNLLIETLGAMKDTTYNGPIKFGTIYMFGTGGDMEGGASEAAMEVFTNPKEYDCLAFQDVWEETGDIGYFVPYELGLNEFKDEEGNTDLPRATRYVDQKRGKLQRGKSKKPLYDEMQNNPRYPSEAFLTMNSNIFPVGELKEHLGWLRSALETDGFVKGQCGELIWEQSDNTQQPKLKWKPDLSGKLTPTWFKMKKSDDTTGCVQIWEHPKEINGQIPFGLYIAGTDPYDQDQSVSTASLGSTYIYKTFHTEQGIYEWPVAEYTARPGTAEEHHENIRKLLMYYNAVDLYENERNTLKMHFSHKHSLHLLARTPTMLKATEGSKVQRQYGIHMTQQIKDELEIYTRDWLLQEAGDGKLNLHKIYSPALLQELIFYNREGNFDRVIAFMLAICHRLMNYHIKVEEVKKETAKQDPFLQRASQGGFFNNAPAGGPGSHFERGHYSGETNHSVIGSLLTNSGASNTDSGAGGD